MKKRLENLEKQAKSNSKTDGIFSNSEKDQYIKSLCDRFGISYDSNIVPIWKEFLIIGDDSVAGT